MVRTPEELDAFVQTLAEQQNDMVRQLYQLHARTALNNPEKRLVVGIANRISLEKLELLETYDEEIFYKNNRKVVKARLSVEEETDITQAQFLCWHLLLTLGNMTQDEIAVEYGFSSFVKHTANRIKEMNQTKVGRALIVGAESRFRQELERCLTDE